MFPFVQNGYNVDADSQQALWRERKKYEMNSIKLPLFNKNWNWLQNQSNKCQQPTATDVINYKPNAET